MTATNSIVLALTALHSNANLVISWSIMKNTNYMSAATRKRHTRWNFFHLRTYLNIYICICIYLYIYIYMYIYSCNTLLLIAGALISKKKKRPQQLCTKASASHCFFFFFSFLLRSLMWNSFHRKRNKKKEYIKRKMNRRKKKRQWTSNKKKRNKWQKKQTKRSVMHSSLRYVSTKTKKKKTVSHFNTQETKPYGDISRKVILMRSRAPQ